MNTLVKNIALLYIVTNLLGCSHLKTLVGIGPKRPKVSIEEVVFVSLSMKNLKLKLRLKVFNPNDIDLSLHNAKYSVTIDGNDFAKGEHKKEILAVKNAYSLVTIPITINLNSTGLIFKKSLLSGKKPMAKWNIEAEFQGPIGNIDVSFEDEKPLY